MNLNHERERKEIVIDNTHPVFAGSPLERDEFKFRCRVLELAEEMRINRKNTRKGRKGRDDTDQLEVILDTLDAVVMGWEGVNDTKGAPIACTSENKRKIFNAYPEIAGYLSDALAEARDQNITEAEEAQKN